MPEGRIRRGQRLPTTLRCWYRAVRSRSRWVRGALTAGVANLNADFGIVAMRVHKVRDPLPSGYLRVVPQARIPRRNAPLRIHRCRFGYDERRAARGERP